VIFRCAFLLCATPLLAQLASTAALPPPDAARQQAIILSVQEKALDAQSRLPDFICTQLTKRSEDRTGEGGHWKKRDSLEIEFSFVDRRPNWKLVKINGKKTRRTYDDLNSGFISDALLQYFSLPGGLFGKNAGTIFQWGRWDQIGGKQAAVFAIRVPAAASQLVLSNAWSHNIIGFHGLMYVDPQASEILRLEVTLDMPRGSGAQDSDVMVDYGAVAIGSDEFLLPVRAVVHMRDPVGLAKNEIEVVKYQKYGADSRITFGDQ
jgi:hypothetical protein